MLKIGLTGNIGCGKSSVSSELKKHGIEIIDADIISREIYEYEDMLEKIKKYFPSAIKNSKVDRKELGKIVFSDRDKLELLNKLTHTKIKEVVLERLKEANEKKHIAVLDAALLCEAAFDDMVDKLVVVYCKDSEQLKRVVLRDAISEEEALKRIKSQMSQMEKVKRADYVIDNSSTLDDLKKNTEKLLEEIKKWKYEYGGI